MDRRTLILTVGALCVCAFIWINRESPATNIVEATSRAAPSPLATTAPKAPSSSVYSSWLIERDALNQASADPFNAKQPPPPPTVIVPLPPPPRPVSPPFPYKYFGRVRSADGAEKIFLARENQLIPILEKANLEGGYSVDSISSTEIVVIYVPLKERTVIRLPSNLEQP